VRLRSHLEADLGTLRETRFRFVPLAGDPVDEDVSGVIAGMREGRRFYADDVPAGSWTFTGTKGLEVTQRFDSAEVESTWLYAHPEDLNELEIELWTPSAVLDPGESLALHQELEVRPL
jgi:hypothetical protein